jgi:hypothetical protein
MDRWSFSRSSNPHRRSPLTYQKIEDIVILVGAGLGVVLNCTRGDVDDYRATVIELAGGPIVSKAVQR